jgi:hypothetical protein
MIMAFVCLAVTDCTLIARKHALAVACIVICATKVTNKRRGFIHGSMLLIKKIQKNSSQTNNYTQVNRFHNFVLTQIRKIVTDRFVTVATLSHIQKLNNIGCEDTFPETRRRYCELKKQIV